MRKITPVVAIREFFQADGGRKITVNECKPLTREDRIELGVLCAAELGPDVELEIPAVKG